MSIYLKTFINHNKYNEYINSNSLILPNVSLCEYENDIHFNPYNPYINNGHEYIEIGGVKWATMNIGANSIIDFGLYFQWGDTQGYTAAQVGSGEGKKYFSWTDYKYTPNGVSWSVKPDYKITKYINADGKTTLDTSDDAAQANWGSNWRMPTASEFQVLVAATTYAWTSDYEGSGVTGLALTSKNDSSKKLFFPAAGMCTNGKISFINQCTYWSSTLNIKSVERALTMISYDNKLYWNGITDRDGGAPIRPILDE